MLYSCVCFLCLILTLFICFVCVQRFVATYLSHLKKHKISQEGAFVLVRDLDEYLSVIDDMECPDVIDMISSVREIAYVFMAPTENISKMITEQLAHLDTQIVLSLLRSRTDYSNRAPWVKQLNQLYPSFQKWDALFPWEESENFHAEGAETSSLPETLRKVSIAKSAMLAPLSKKYGGAAVNTSASAAAAAIVNVAADKTTGPAAANSVYHKLKNADKQAAADMDGSAAGADSSYSNAAAAEPVFASNTPMKPPPSQLSTPSSSRPDTDKGSSSSSMWSFGRSKPEDSSLPAAPPAPSSGVPAAVPQRSVSSAPLPTETSSKATTTSRFGMGKMSNIFGRS